MHHIVVSLLHLCWFCLLYGCVHYHGSPREREEMVQSQPLRSERTIIPLFFGPRAVGVCVFRVCEVCFVV